MLPTAAGSSLSSLHIRADGNSAIGLGHIIRTSSIAASLSNSWDIHYYCYAPGEYITSLCSESGWALHQLDSEEEMLPPAEGNASIALLDHYELKTEYQKQLMAAGYTLVVIDDMMEWEHHAHLLINHAFGVSSADYSGLVQPYTHLALGPNYALLRPEFLEAAEKNTFNRKDFILLSMGGADPARLTLLLAELLLEVVPDKPIHVLLGGAYPHKDDLRQLHNYQDSGKVVILNKASATQMVQLLLTASAAVLPASSVSIEAISCRTPLLVGYYTSNQHGIYNGLMKEYCGIGMGDLKKLTATQLSIYLHELEQNLDKIVDNQKSIIDGRSMRRLTASIERIK